MVLFFSLIDGVLTDLSHRCEFFDLHSELVPYESAWSWQKSMVAKRHALMDRGEDHCDALIALQHPPVYTLGTGSLEEYLKFDADDAPFEVFRTERGGEVTFHGPGQVMAPIKGISLFFNPPAPGAPWPSRPFDSSLVHRCPF